MSETDVRRRGHGEDGIYLDAARNRYMGAVSLGYGPEGKRIRRKVSGKTKREVRAKLQALHQEVSAGVRSSSTYTVRATVDDWLREGLDDTSERTRALYEGLLGPLLEIIGARLLRLSAGDVRLGLSKLPLVTPPGRCRSPITRRSGRPSKSFTLAEAKAALAASEQTRLHAYIVLSLLIGIRTEEARALRWDHLVTWVDDAAGWQPVTASGFDLSRAGESRFALFVWRSAHEASDTKTKKSRRTLALPRRCVEALRQQQEQQEQDRLAAGELWQEHGLVFASRVGTPLSANNVIRAFRIITKKAGLGEDWVPREMRHTFVSVLAASGIPVGGIALLVGHDHTATTESVYRHEIRPALTQCAEVMDKIFG